MGRSEMPVYYKCPNYFSEEATVSFTDNFGDLSWTLPICLAVRIVLSIMCLFSDLQNGSDLHTPYYSSEILRL